MQIYAYLNFDGKCREAMNFCKDCLGGELELTTVAGSPMEAQMPPEAAQSISHAKLTNGALVLMASDAMGMDVTHGNSVALALSCDSQEEIQHVFSHLAAGGQIDHPLGPAFWGGTFGHFTDKFGMSWLVTCEK